MADAPIRRSWKQLVLVPALTFAALAAIGGSTVSWAARRMLFPIPSAPSNSPIRGRADVEVVELASKTEAWYLPPHPSASDQKGPAPVLVFTHGNGELIDYWLDEFEPARRWGMGVLLVEYPGYGRSPGSPSQASVTRTMIQAYDWLTRRDDVDASRIVPYGRSLGGGAATQLAANRKVAALILESTFTSVRRIAQDMGAPGFLIRDPFDSLQVVKDFPGPILGVHGTTDRVIPYQHALDLERDSQNYRLVTLSCGHNDCPRQWDAIHEFLVEHGLLVTRR